MYAEALVSIGLVGSYCPSTPPSAAAFYATSGSGSEVSSLSMRLAAGAGAATDAGGRLGPADSEFGGGRSMRICELAIGGIYCPLKMDRLSIGSLLIRFATVGGGCGTKWWLGELGLLRLWSL